MCLFIAAGGTGGSDDLNYITSSKFASELHLQFIDHFSLQAAHTQTVRVDNIRI
jgi:hypothetical protein